MAQLIMAGVRVRWRPLIPAALFAVAAAFHMSYAGCGIAVFDLGILLGDTDRVLRGEVFGRDFIAPYGPGSYYLLAPILALFGRSLFVVSAVFALLRALLDVLTYRLAVPLMGRGVALLPFALAAVAHGSLHKSFLAAAQLLALFGLAVLVRRDTVRHKLTAGALSGAALLLRYDVGVFALVSLVVASAFQHTARTRIAGVGRDVAWLAAGALLVLVPAAAGLLARGLDPQWWWDHVWQRIRVQEAIAAPYPRVLEALHRGDLKPLVRASWIGLGVLLPIVATLLASRAGERRALVAGVACFGLLMMNQVRLIPSLNHFLQVSTAPYLLLGFLLALALRGWLARGGLRRAAALAILAGPWLITTWRVTAGADDPYPGSFTQAWSDAVPLPGARGGMRAPRDQVAAFCAVIDFVHDHTQPGDRILASSNCPLFYFLCDRAPAIPFVEPAYYYRPERYEQEAIDAVERWRPPVFIDDQRAAATFAMAQAAPEFYAHLARWYRQAAVVPPFILCLRRR
ncbi:MAG: hypothetical protein U1E76_12005 [Planctomycetota bacterium]